MKFICFCYYDTEKFAKLTRPDFEEMRRECPPHDAALRATGRLLTQGSLSFPDTWTVARPSGPDSAPALSTGPYLPTPQQVGAFFIIDAKDTAEATAIAAKHPAANYGSHIGFAVEVRECEMYEQIETDDDPPM